MEPVLDVRLCLEEQHYSVMYIFVHFYIFSFCFVKKKLHKEASTDLMRETGKRKKPAWGV